MQIVSTLPDLRSARLSFSGIVGLVPTMGYLHEVIFLLSAAQGRSAITLWCPFLSTRCSLARTRTSPGIRATWTVT